MKRMMIKRRFLIAALLVCLCLAASLTVLTIAKYVLDSREENLGIVAGEDFIFYTTLDENTEATPYLVYDGEINFTLKNNNALIATSPPITYTVAISGDVGTIKVDGEAYNAPQILTGDADGGEDHVAISGLTDGLYAVTIQSTAPYTKAIRLYFKVELTNDRTYYTVTYHDTWCELDIYTGADASPILIDYTGAPDNTDSRMATWGMDGEGELHGLTPYAHYKLIFFNVSEDFVLTQNQTPLEQGGASTTEGE